MAMGSPKMKDTSLRSPFGRTPPLLSMIDKPDRGLSLITTARIKAGQVILVDSPSLIYPSMAALPLICSHCFRALPSEPLPCTKCNVARFCSPQCLSHSHPSLLCHALPNLTTGNYRFCNLLIFLLSAYSLPPFTICSLLSLRSHSRPYQNIVELHSQLTSLISDHNLPLLFSLYNSSALLCKEKINSFALPLPRGQIQRFQDAGVTDARAFGLYLWASMINHDCMPNICRFHYIDNPKIKNNTIIMFRALHTIEKGSEICTSYVDFKVGYSDRRKKLLYNYDFVCECYRCVSEGREEAEEENKEVMVVTASKYKETGENSVVEEAKVGAEEQEQEQEISDGSGGGQTIISDYCSDFICECGGFVANCIPKRDAEISRSRECNACGTIYT